MLNFGVSVQESTPEQSTASTLKAAQKLKDSYEQMKQKFLAEGLDVVWQRVTVIGLCMVDMRR